MTDFKTNLKIALIIGVIVLLALAILTFLIYGLTQPWRIYPACYISLCVGLVLGTMGR